MSTAHETASDAGTAVPPRPAPPGEPRRATRANRVETRGRILRHLRDTGRATVDDLAAALGVSTVTVHRYLATLEGEGVIARPRGGAQLLDPASAETSSFALRAATQVAQKEAIARAAMAYLPPPGAAIFVDASTTCLFLAQEIVRSATTELTIVTTSPALLNQFTSRTVRVIALPGELDQLARVIGGAWTVEFLSTLHVQAAFISGVGLTLEAGLTSERRAIGDVLKEVVKRSPHTYMLVDSSKFGRTALLHIAWPWEVTAVITDGGLDAGVVNAYTEHGVALQVAHP